MEKLNKIIRQIAVCMVIVYSAAVFTGCGTVNVKMEDAVMEAAGQTVVRAEYEMILSGYVSEVKRQYSTDEVNSDKFWTTEIDGNLPLEQIMQLAEEEILHKKTVAYLAKEAKVAQETDYVSIMAQLESKTSAEGITYGLTSYEPKDYYTYIYTGIESDLIESFKQEKEISEDELREIYADNIEKYTNEVSVQMLIAEMHADIGMDLAVQTAESMKETTDITILHEKYPKVNFYELGMSTQNTEEGKSGGYRMRWLAAQNMQEGDICEPFVIGKNIMTMRCLAREENAPTDFEDVKGIIESEVQTKWAKEKIEKAKKEAEIKYEKEVLEKIALEALAGK